jgi:hypothetical protein
MPRGPALASANPKVVKMPVVIEMNENGIANDSNLVRLRAKRWR